MKRRSPCTVWTVCSSALWLALSASAIGVSQQTNPPAIAVPSAAQPPPSASLPAQPSLYRITGTVIDTVTKSPIPNATLTAAPMTTVKRSRGPRRRGQNRSDSGSDASTDSNGHFDLAVPSAGGWELTASARGYRTQSLDEHDGYSSAVVVTEAAPRFRVTFRMTPASMIEGFILDEAGETVRGANVALIYLPPPTPDNQHPRPQSRNQQTTDDRGFYKFGTLGPGNYEVRVTAHPWYATAAAGSDRFSSGGLAQPERNSVSAAPDPLDVVYPTVWYPGAADPSAATPIILRGGDTQEANFRLLPMAGSHLRVASPAASVDRDPQLSAQNTYLTRLLPDGTEDGQQTPTRMDGHGSADIAGLSSGTYLVHQQLPSGSPVLSTIQIGAGSARVVDLSEGTPAATVTVQVDPAADLDSLQISFREVETGHITYAQRFQDAGRQPLRHRGQQLQNDAAGDTRESHAARPDRTISLPPGKYEVFLNGVGDVHLASIEATGATAAGRLVTIGSGSAKLFLHTAAGLGTVTGIASLKGQPLPGAMVMLIPATLGSAAGLDLPSRDQTNTDGSFEMTGLLPGGYILIAIDHGWEVNWSDPSTLRRYLLHGLPLEIKPGSDLKQTIEAQSP